MIFIHQHFLYIATIYHFSLDSLSCVYRLRSQYSLWHSTSHVADMHQAPGLLPLLLTNDGSIYWVIVVTHSSSCSPHKVGDSMYLFLFSVYHLESITTSCSHKQKKTMTHKQCCLFHHKCIVWPRKRERAKDKRLCCLLHLAFHLCLFCPQDIITGICNAPVDMTVKEQSHWNSWAVWWAVMHY